jgi:hypothetical protein
MSTPFLRVVEGWTGTLGPFTLMAEVVPSTDPPTYAPINLASLTVAVMLRQQNGTPVAVTGVVNILDQVVTTGQVTFSPGPNDFKMQTNGFTVSQMFQMHFKVTDSLGKAIFIPDDASADVMVTRA